MAKQRGKKVGYSYKNAKEMNVFWSICRNIRGNESGLIAGEKYFRINNNWQTITMPQTKTTA